MPPINERDLDELLTPTQAAALLHVSPATTYRLIATRQIESVRVGLGRGRVFVTRRAALDYLNRRVTRAERRTRSSA